MTYDQIDRIHHMRPVIGERVRHRISGHDGTVIEPVSATRRGKHAPTVRIDYPRYGIGFHDPRSLLWLDRTPGEQLPDIEEAGERA